MNGLDSYFPDEAVMHILSYLSPDQLLVSRSVCSRWKVLSEDPSLWKRFFVAAGCISNDDPAPKDWRKYFCFEELQVTRALSKICDSSFVPRGESLCSKASIYKHKFFVIRNVLVGTCVTGVRLWDLKDRTEIKNKFLETDKLDRWNYRTAEDGRIVAMDSKGVYTLDFTDEEQKSEEVCYTEFRREPNCRSFDVLENTMAIVTNNKLVIIDMPSKHSIEIPYKLQADPTVIITQTNILVYNQSTSYTQKFLEIFSRDGTLIKEVNLNNPRGYCYNNEAFYYYFDKKIYKLCFQNYETEVFCELPVKKTSFYKASLCVNSKYLVLADEKCLHVVAHDKTIRQISLDFYANYLEQKGRFCICSSNRDHRAAFVDLEEGKVLREIKLLSKDNLTTFKKKKLIASSTNKGITLFDFS